MRVKARIYTVVPYMVDIHLATTEEAAAYSSRILGFKLEEDDTHVAFCQRYCDRDGCFGVLLVLPKACDTPVIAHECIHAVLRVFQHVGVVVTPDTAEPLAYHVEHLMGWVITNLK